MLLEKQLNNNAKLISFTILILLWFLISHFNLLGRTLLASPGEVFEIIVNSTKDNASKSEKFYIHAFYTIKLALSGWLLALFWGVIFGIIIGNLRLLKKLSEPIIDFFRSIPPILAFPLFLVSNNYSFQAYIWTIFFGTFPLTIITIANGFEYISNEKLKVLNIHNIDILLKSLIKFFEIMPSIITSARLSLSLSLIIAVVTEMVFTPRSGWALGALARDAELNFNTPMFYACVISIGVFGYIANNLLIKLGNYFK